MDEADNVDVAICSIDKFYNALTYVDVSVYTRSFQVYFTHHIKSEKQFGMTLRVVFEGIIRFVRCLKVSSNNDGRSKDTKLQT